MNKIVNLALCALILVGVGCAEATITGTDFSSNTPPEALDLQAPEFHGIVAIADGDDSSAISLLDAASGQVSEAEFLHSGTQKASLTTFFSDDVVAASSPGVRNEIVLIDRANSTLTFVDPKTKEIRVQYSVGEPGYGANPYDYTAVSTDTGYVARFGVVLGDNNKIIQGNDILVLNPDNGQALASIDLSVSVTAVPNTTATTYARPGGITLIGQHAYVVLCNQTENFVQADASIAVIDIVTHKIVNTLRLDGYRNCGPLVYAAAVSSAYTLCGGTFFDLERAKQDGILTLDVADSAVPTVSGVVDPTDIDAGTYTSVFGGLSLIDDASVVLVFEGIKDWTTGNVSKDETVYAVDLNAGAGSAKVVHSAETAFALSVYAEQASGLIYIADKTFGTESLIVYNHDGNGDVSEKHRIEPGASGLTPSRLYPY